jgi:hypothetical protein
MGVPFDVNETCGKVTGGFATPGSAGRKAKPTRLKTPPKSPPKVIVARGEILWKKTEVVNGSKGFQSPQMTRLSFAL